MMDTHRMLKVVTKEVDEPQAVLIRTLEPLAVYLSGHPYASQMKKGQLLDFSQVWL